MRLPILLALACGACAAGPSSSPGGRRGTPPPADGAVSVDAGPSTDRTPPDAARVAPIEDGGACASIGREARREVRPVDIVWVIDGSPSMEEEAAVVRDNMNAFAAHMEAQSIDYRVVLVAGADFIRIPPPLGVDAERFLHVDQHVDSWHALQELVDAIPRYGSFLRPEALLHFVALTDDESLLMTDDEFEAAIDMQLGRPFTFHAIASPPGSSHEPRNDSDRGAGCEGPFGYARNNGLRYWALAERTGGLAQSVCAADWSMLFDRLTETIADVEYIPCRFRVPDPPEGEVYARDRVNVRYTPGGGEAELVPGSNPEFPCDDQEWRWVGDDEIELCPEACARIGSDDAGRIEILFGCETLIY